MKAKFLLAAALAGTWASVLGASPAMAQPIVIEQTVVGGEPQAVTVPGEARLEQVLAGIVLGVAVYVGMHTANQTVLYAFSHTVDRIAGKTELQVTAGETVEFNLFVEDEQPDAGASKIELAFPEDVLAELRRTGAFDRKILVIATTTGTGFLDQNGTDPLEYLWNGDTAIAGVQYSYLPSWISFLADQQKSVEAGKAMVDAIHGRWLQWPADRRPQLALYGESLGSMAGQGAFGYLPDVVDMDFSSVLWVGPPNASSLWHAITVRRDPGTPEVKPRYDNGRTVRFSQGNDAQQIAQQLAVLAKNGKLVPAAAK